MVVVDVEEVDAGVEDAAVEANIFDIMSIALPQRLGPADFALLPFRHVSHFVDDDCLFANNKPVLAGPLLCHEHLNLPLWRTVRLFLFQYLQNL